MPAPSDPPPVSLLPEFDALLCGYDPKARERFVGPEHYRRLWSPDNGMLLAPLLCRGRLTGYWRLPGSGTRRACEVVWFAGTPPSHEGGARGAPVRLGDRIRDHAHRPEHQQGVTYSTAPGGTTQWQDWPVTAAIRSKSAS
ncbi:MAG: DNA glycosylase AlkZ-like family protein [Ornithinimicrobium sp.]|uniref:DNA glycosylase AlkZ-like family protein n=1 Tax=Ornithinimicrobium sp. TaxID=1977084 RepID=UPI003D9BA95F